MDSEPKFNQTNSLENLFKDPELNELVKLFFISLSDLGRSYNSIVAGSQTITSLSEDQTRIIQEAITKFQSQFQQFFGNEELMPYLSKILRAISDSESTQINVEQISTALGLTPEEFDSQNFTTGYSLFLHSQNE